MWWKSLSSALVNTVTQERVSGMSDNFEFRETKGTRLCGKSFLFAIEMGPSSTRELLSGLFARVTFRGWTRIGFRRGIPT